MRFVAITVTVLAIGWAFWNGSAVSFASETNGNSLNSVNGGVSASPGVTYDTVSTVNGGITIGRGASANQVKTVNGGITVEDAAKLGKVSTVNGGLRLGENVTVEHEASTVNGGVKIGRNSRVGGDVTTVSGGITLDGAEVAGSVETGNGDIDLAEGAHVHGHIHVKEKSDSGWSFGKDDRIEVNICGTCVVDGELRFDRAVVLHLENGAKTGAVIGEEITRR